MPGRPPVGVAPPAELAPGSDRGILDHLLRIFRRADHRQNGAVDAGSIRLSLPMTRRRRDSFP
ncbi:MAG TPA: hypothetical protein VIK06_10360 [Candidatus Limnocylindrales bacterium]